MDKDVKSIETSKDDQSMDTNKNYEIEDTANTDTKDAQECRGEKKMEVKKAPALQEVESVFAAMDVREKVKAMEKMKQKTLGDFVTLAKPRQKQGKKKKKKGKSDGVEEEKAVPEVAANDPHLALSPGR